MGTTFSRLATAFRVLLSIPDPGHPHPAILDQDSADGLCQFDFLCGANEGLVAAIDGAKGAVGGPQLFLDACALRDFSQQKGLSAQICRPPPATEASSPARK
jgi:hypothetical protein